MEKKYYNTFFCSKCSYIPLIQLIIDKKNFDVFTSCKCHKKYLNIEHFTKNYYKTNIDYSKINQDSIFPKYIKKDQKILSAEEKEKKINEIINNYNKIKEEIKQYSKEIKDKLINTYLERIKQLEEFYTEYNNTNQKIESIFDQLIETYKINKTNDSAYQNILYNSNINKNFRRVSNNYDSVSSFYKNNFLLLPPDKQFEKTNYFYKHSKGVNCFLELNKIFYGASSSYDSKIIFYDLRKDEAVFSFKAHEKKVNYIDKTLFNNIFSCGGDDKIKIWPSFDQEMISQIKIKIDQENEIKNKNKPYRSNYKDISTIINPIYEYSTKNEEMKKILVINEKYFLAGSIKSIHLFEYKINEKENKIGINLIKTCEEKNIDFIFINSEINGQLIVGYNYSQMFWRSFPELEKMDEIKIKMVNDRNHLIQIDDNNILFYSNRRLNVFNINKKQIKFYKKISNDNDCLLKLKDGTVVQGGREGIKRYFIKNFKELPTLGDGYNEYEDYETGYYAAYGEPEEYEEPQCILFMKELSDGRIVICYQQNEIIIHKIKFI